MARDQVDLRGDEATLLMTLAMRARDARSPRPVLGDRIAVETLARVRHDPLLLTRFATDTTTICVRARQLDIWTTAFLAEHPEGQVLHLGCGLDSRPVRVRRPRGSRWVDVDVPRVAALRRELLDLPDDVEVVASSVTDDGWWAHVEPGRPTLVVAEGLFMYLEPARVRELVERLTARTTSGVLVFDAVAGWTVPLANATPGFREIGARFRWGYDPAELDGLRVLDDVRVTELGARWCGRWEASLLFRALDALPLVRDAMRVHRLAYGPIAAAWSESAAGR